MGAPLMQSGVHAAGAAASPYVGAGKENQLPKTTPLTLLWFGAASAVVLGAFLGALACLSSFELVDSLEMWYLVVFGMILAILDTPVFVNVSIVPAMRPH